MRIKKFRCIQCGGPKVNPYTMPYIMCDFCGSFTDIDFAVGMEKWNESAPATINYQFQKMALMSRAQMTLAAGDQRGYFAIQREYWDFYYRSFPAYLPPSIDTDLKYAIYLEICAVSSTETAFDSKWQQYGARQQQLQSELRYLNDNGQMKAETETFFRLAEYFVSITREGMQSFYCDPKYARMHELLPELVRFKMKSSMSLRRGFPICGPTMPTDYLRCSDSLMSMSSWNSPPGKSSHVRTANINSSPRMVHIGCFARIAARPRRCGRSSSACRAGRRTRYRRTPQNRSTAATAASRTG